MKTFLKSNNNSTKHLKSPILLNFSYRTYLFAWNLKCNSVLGGK